MIASLDDRQNPEVGRRVELHTFRFGGSARLFFVTVVVSLLVGVPGGTGYLLVTGQARELGNLFAFATVLCLLTYFQARERPLAYATRDGLDLQWAWGKQRRIAWRDIRSLKATTLFGWFTGHRFRLELTNGSVEFYARSDLPRIIAQFQRDGSAG